MKNISLRNFWKYVGNNISSLLPVIQNYENF